MARWPALGLGFLMLLVGSRGDAASIVANPTAAAVDVGETVTIALEIALAPGEDASTFQGQLSLSGPALFASEPSTFGETWLLADAGLVAGDSSVILTLLTTTDGNRNDHSLLAELVVRGLAPGVVALSIDPGAILARDLSVSPFSELVPLGPASGSILAEITVVPEPGTGLLVGLAIGMLSLARRERVT